MRITRDSLLKVVRDTVTRRIRSDRGLVSIYLCGSLLNEDDYLLGGATDIDLVFIHADATPEAREIVPITNEIHLDISHHQHRDYRQTRKLRVHPWMGPTIYSCTILHDPQHFMNFTQASVRGQYDHAEYVMERARGQAEHARQMWFEIQENEEEPGPEEIGLYFKALEHAVNAIASLSGPPLTRRRFLLDFPARAETVGQPGLYPGLLGLIGASKIDVETLSSWLPAWESAFESAFEVEADPGFHPARRSYYLQAFKDFIKKEQPQLAVWPLQRTWTLAVTRLPGKEDAQKNWRDAFTTMGLLGKAFEERIRAFDSYLDLVEETLESWAKANGVI